MISFLSENNHLSVSVILAACFLYNLISLTCLASPVSLPTGFSNEYDQQDYSTTSKLLQAQHSVHKHRDSHMTLYKLELGGNNVTCNDGSQAGYYMRLNSQSTSWVIYLQGGGFCESEESCQQRWQTNPHLMSSNFWPKTKKVDGILSNNPKENPYLWHANHIFVPYCSSDSWTGLSSAVKHEVDSDNVGSSFTFMGSKIFEHVLESLYDDLPRESSLLQAKHILLAGDSAGGMGVLLNLDKANSIIQQRTTSITCSTNIHQQLVCQQKQAAPIVRGLADSGWFLDNEPFDVSQDMIKLGGSSSTVESAGTTGEMLDCVSSRCAPLQSVKQAIRLWNGQVPIACANQFPLEPWRCYFGYRAYPTIKTPVFIVQWLYDEAQLLVDNIARPVTSKQWTYVDKVSSDVRQSLENVTALFAPSCFSHSLITKSVWNQITIDGLNVPQLLNSWFDYTLTNDNAQEQLSSYNIPTEENNHARQQSSHSDSPTVIQTSSYAPINDQESTQLHFNKQRESTQLHQSQSNQEQRLIVNKWQQYSPGTSNNRTRSRKRKRNNQQQRNKQVRSKSSQNYLSSTPINPYRRDANQLLSTVNPLEDLLPLIDSSQDTHSLGSNKHSNNGPSNNGRPGRSAIVEDSTSVMSNNMQEDNQSHLISLGGIDSRLESRLGWTGNLQTRPNNQEESSTYLHAKQVSLNQFKLIDSCHWPYCNRDCPNLDSESSLTAIQY